MQNRHIADEINPTKGIIICLISYFFVSLIGLCEKGVSSSVTIPTILFFQNAVCLLLVLPSVAFRGTHLLKTSELRSHAIRILSGLGCYGMLFYLIRFIPISEALIYQYAASLWIPLIAFIWLRVPTANNLWYGITIGFIGVLFVLNPHRAAFDMIAIIGILCGVFQAISIVAIRKLSVTEPSTRILFYYSAVGTLITLPFFIEHLPHLSLRDTGLLCGVGLSTYFGQQLIAISLQYASAATLAPICYACIPFAGILDWLLWKELPTKSALWGITLVILGCFVTLFAAKTNAERPSDSFHEIETGEGV